MSKEENKEDLMGFLIREAIDGLDLESEPSDGLFALAKLESDHRERMHVQAHRDRLDAGNEERKAAYLSDVASVKEHRLAVEKLCERQAVALEKIADYLLCKNTQG